jgi:two-component system sensor histidine kinase HydH
VKNAAESIEDAGKIIITLKSPRNNRIYLTIRDTGTGIEGKKAKHIFDPFYTTKPEGTGIGLSIIHRIIDTYDGMIDFESIPGKGSVFTILFKNAKTNGPISKSNHTPEFKKALYIWTKIASCLSLEKRK